MNPLLQQNSRSGSLEDSGLASADSADKIPHLQPDHGETMAGAPPSPPLADERTGYALVLERGRREALGLLNFSTEVRW